MILQAPTRPVRRLLWLGAVALSSLVAPAWAQASIRVSDVTVTEGDGPVEAAFTVTRSAPAFSGAVTVSYATSDATATAPSDYSATSGALRFEGALLGSTTSQRVTVPVSGDALDENDETFELTISAPSEIDDATGVATIVDDDELPALTVADAPAVREDAGRPATFVLALSAPSGRPVTLRYATADRTATAPADYRARSGALTIPAGEARAEVAVPVVDDDRDEAGEAFELRISEVINATVSRGTAIGSIEDDDGARSPPADGGSGTGDSSGGSSPPAEGGSPGAPGPSPTAGSDRPPLRIGVSAPRLRRPYTALVTIACPAARSRCSGRLTLLTRARPASRIRALRSVRRLGRRPVALRGGQVTTLRLRLARADRRLLRRAGRLHVRAVVATSAADGRRAVRRINGRLVARTRHSSAGR